MKRIFLSLLILSAFTLQTFAQSNEMLQSTYRATATKTHQIKHTKLDVRFDFEKAWMYGKEWLTLQPYFYAADSVVLDAKGMEIKEVALITGATKKTQKHAYNGMQLTVYLDKNYKASEEFTLYFEYISKPNDYKAAGSAAINDARGLYFIDPKGEDPTKPTQIWTQGETEASSVWFITIDKPNQSTTQELTMTVPDKFVTLSNGLLINQKKNSDGTRSDTWKLDIPHAPYLFFMGVGEYSVIKDNPFKGKEISYYVDKEYEPHAKEIFGNTAEMIQFYEDFTGFPYIWPKYSQIVGKDYVSGAMENSTAVIHQESVYQNDRQLVDGNHWESTIAHEIFHHWFGNVVTTESWSNLTINESFANYSEYLWFEYKYGKDEADKHAYDDRQGYLNNDNELKDLVRYHYNDKEDMFDAVSYNKGGRILHMLRYYVGDEAFKKALQSFLNTYKHKPVEATQLRLTFEEVTGQDLNWFWNQWYYGNGHPKLSVTYNIDDKNKVAQIIVKQKGKNFRLPVAVDIYTGKEKVRHQRWISNRVDTLSFEFKTRPTFMQMDPDRVLLAVIDEDKPEAFYVEQMNLGGAYENRRDAIDYFAKNTMPDIAKGLIDKFYGIRIHTMEKLATSPFKNDPVVLKTIEGLAKLDLNKNAKAAAIEYLAKLQNKSYMPLFMENVNDVSYSVSGAALKGIAALDKQTAVDISIKQSNDARGGLAVTISGILMDLNDEVHFDKISTLYNAMPLSDEKLEQTLRYINYLYAIKDNTKLKAGIDNVMATRNSIPSIYRPMLDNLFKSQLNPLGNKKGKEIKKYIDEAFE